MMCRGGKGLAMGRQGGSGEIRQQAPSELHIGLQTRDGLRREVFQQP